MKNTTPIFINAFLLSICLVLFSPHSNGQKATVYHNDKGEFWVQGLKEPDPFRIEKGKPGWGIYLWEYPDGEYQLFTGGANEYTDATWQLRAQTPKYQLKPGEEATLFITPFNAAFDKPENIRSTKRDAPRNSFLSQPLPFKYPDFEPKMLTLQMNSKGDIVENHDIRAAVRFRGDKGSSGKIIILYGKNNFKRFGQTLTIKYPVNYFEKKSPTKDKFQFTFQQRKFLLDKGYDLEQFEVYDIGKMTKDVQSFFFTIHPVFNTVDIGILKDAPKDKTISIAVIWLPDQKDLSENMVEEKTFKIEQAEDPNNLKGPKVAYLRCNCVNRKVLTYRINFQNRGEYIAKDILIYLLMSDKNGFDINSFELKQVIPKFDSSNKSYNASHWNSKDGDTLFLKLPGFGLQPWKGLFGNRDSKGAVDFSIAASPYQGRSNLESIVHFLGAPPVSTGGFVTKWRQRGLHLKTGYVFGTRQSERFNLPYTVQHKSPPLNVSLSWQNTALGRGLIYGWEAGLNRSDFVGDSVYLRNNGAILPYNGLYHFELLDAKAIVGIQANSFFRLIAGAGYSFPLIANQTIVSDPLISYIVAPVLYTPSQYHIQYGYLQRKKQAGTDSREVFDYRATPGFIFQLGAEIGIMHTGVIGLEYQTRIFSDFYPQSANLKTFVFPTNYHYIDTFGKSESISNFNLYFRFKIPNPVCWFKQKASVPH